MARKSVGVSHAINLPVGDGLYMFIQSIYGLGWCTLGFTMGLPWVYHGFSTWNDPSSWLAQKCRFFLRLALSLYDTSLRILATASGFFSGDGKHVSTEITMGGANVWQMLVKHGESMWIWYHLYLKLCLNLALMTILRCHHWGIQCGNIYANGSGVLAQDLLLLSCEDLPVQSLVQEPLRGCY